MGRGASVVRGVARMAARGWAAPPKQYLRWQSLGTSEVDRGRDEVGALAGRSPSLLPRGRGEAVCRPPACLSSRGEGEAALESS